MLHTLSGTPYIMNGKLLLAVALVAALIAVPVLAEGGFGLACTDPHLCQSARINV